MPLFLILDAFDTLYFWPGWTAYAPPDANDIDFRLTDFSQGDTAIAILPSIWWPDTGMSGSQLQFISAVVNRSMTDLASNLAVTEWSFE